MSIGRPSIKPKWLAVHIPPTHYGVIFFHHITSLYYIYFIVYSPFFLLFSPSTSYQHPQIDRPNSFSIFSTYTNSLLAKKKEKNKKKSTHPKGLLSKVQCSFSSTPQDSKEDGTPKVKEFEIKKKKMYKKIVQHIRLYLSCCMNCTN